MERAELNLESALGLAPENLDAHHHLARAREQLGKKAEARAQWAKVQELAAGKPDRATLAAEAAAAQERLKP